jgi:hypothetical protein
LGKTLFAGLTAQKLKREGNPKETQENEVEVEPPESHYQAEPGNERKTASRGRMTKNAHIGSSVDDLFEEEGTLDEISIIAIKRLIAWQIQQKIVKQNF